MRTPPPARSPTTATARRGDAAAGGGQGLPAAHRALIEQSHQRCQALGVSRIDRPDHSPLGRPDLELARQRNRRLFDHAAPVMETLYEQIVDSQSMVVLTDATGTVLHALGDDGFLGRARQVALAPGANWSEAAKGTNAVGTALVEERPVLVHADEHYLHANAFLTCSAAPILDPRGNILGVLDVSGDRGSYHPHTMALVTMSARMIENRWLVDDPRHLLRLHFHRRADFIGTLAEGILALGADGRIAGANRSAIDLLGLGTAGLRQHTLASLFDTDGGALLARGRAAPGVPLVVHDGQGRRFHVVAQLAAHAQAPLWAPPAAAAMGAPPTGLPSTGPTSPRLPAPAAAPRPAAPPEAAALAALCGADARLQRLHARIRRVLDRGIPILVVGATGTGKETLARAIHADSARRDGPFVGLAAPATATALDAAWQHAAGGTLFVDEPGDWPLPLQAQLARRLQAPPTAAGPAPQVVAGSRTAPRALVDAGQLREDLVQQLDGLTVQLPALRDRDDFTALAQAIAARLPDAPPLSAPALALLARQPWPGNLRQLHNVLRTAAALAAGEPAIGPDHLPEDFVDAQPAAAAAAPLLQPLGDLELEAIRQMLAACGGNIAQASRRLGISRNTIYRRLRGA